MGSFFPMKQFQHSTKQRGSTQHSPHNKKCHVIGNRSRVGGFIHHGQRGSVHQDYLGRNGTQTAPHTIRNIWFYGRSGGKWQNTTKADKSTGYVLPLVERTRMPRAVQNILETRKIKLCRLLEKHHPAKHHQNTQKEFLMPHIVLEMLRIEQQNSTAKATQANRQKKKHLQGCDYMMIWVVNRYVQRYRLTDRLLANTPLRDAPWIHLRRASHYSIIRIIIQLDNSKSIWIYLFYNLHWMPASEGLQPMPGWPPLTLPNRAPRRLRSSSPTVLPIVLGSPRGGRGAAQ